MLLISFDSMYSIRAPFLNGMGLPLEEALRLIECDLVLYREIWCSVRRDFGLYELSACTYTLDDEQTVSILQSMCGAWCTRRIKKRSIYRRIVSFGVSNRPTDAAIYSTALPYRLLAKTQRPLPCPAG